MKALLLCVFLCCVGCAGLTEWAQGDKNQDGISNAEEAARATEVAGSAVGLWFAPATVAAGIAAAVLRSMAVKKAEQA